MASVTINDPDNYEKYRVALLDELAKVKIPKIVKGHDRTKGIYAGKYVSQRGDVIGMIGRTINFGYGFIRHRGYGPFLANSKYAGVYGALCDYAQALLPPDFHYNVITLNHNVKAKKHKDVYNVGDSIIVGIGPYEGGALRVYSNDTDYVAKNIKDTPIQFNGHTTFHETEDFTGDRYTMIFYKMAKGTTLPKPSRILSPETRLLEETYFNKVRAYYDAKKKEKIAKSTLGAEKSSTGGDKN